MASIIQKSWFWTIVFAIVFLVAAVAIGNAAPVQYDPQNNSSDLNESDDIVDDGSNESEDINDSDDGDGDREESEDQNHTDDINDSDDGDGDREESEDRNYTDDINHTADVVAIDETIIYQNVEYVDGNLRVTFINRGDRPTSIHLVDAGAVFEGGTTDIETRRLLPGESRISVPATVVDGRVVVSVTHDGTVHGIRYQETEPFIGGPWSHDDAIASGVGAAAGVSAATIFVVIRAALGRDEKAERIA